MHQTNNPFISIIVPIRNEALNIESCLLAIAEQSYPTDLMEILVVDGMSSDNTTEIIKDFAARYPSIQIILLNNPGHIVPIGMNIAYQYAKGEIIIRVDGHCIIDKNYVRNCVRHLQHAGVDAVGGPITSVGKTYIAQAIAFAMSSPFGVGNSAFRTVKGETLFVDTVPFPAYSRQIIKLAGGYDEELVRNQDDEYNFRIRKMGGKILLAEDVRSIYFSRTSLTKLWRQYYQYGYWKVRVMQKHPLQMSIRQFLPPIFVLALFFSSFLAIILENVHFLLFIGLPYLTSNFGASLWITTRHTWRSLPLLPLIFAILHISYGFGFLIGLAKFSNRWWDKVGKMPTLEEYL